MNTPHFDPTKHHRRSIRMAGYDYSQPGYYFVTICTKDRQCLFGEVQDGKMILNRFGHLVRREWRQTIRLRSNVRIDAFIIMPNHLHLLVHITHRVGGYGNRRCEIFCRGDARVAPTENLTPPIAVSAHPRGPMPDSLGTIIGSFKSAISKHIHRDRHAPDRPIWQRNYWEHVVGTDEALGNIREYIALNPLNWSKDFENPDRISERSP